jgi:hypothetical protein
MKFGKPLKEISDEIKANFALWMGLPVEARAPDERNQTQWGDKYGVSEHTMSVWKRDPQVHAIANGAMKTFFRSDTYEVIQKMVEDAKKGDWHARRDYLEWQGELGSRTKDARSPVINVTLKEDNAEDES